jgi:hypothetical protein
MLDYKDSQLIPQEHILASRCHLNSTNTAFHLEDNKYGYIFRKKLANGTRRIGTIYHQPSRCKEG